MPLTIRKKLNIGDVDLDGEIEIEMPSGWTGDPCIYLSQDEIKQVISFLQQQLK